MATKCIHIDKPHYSGGLCSNCYLAQYYLKRKQKRFEKQQREKATQRQGQADPADDCLTESIATYSEKEDDFAP